MNVLFHCCCAPCATACIESFASEGIIPALLWYNPNIHPFTEYHSRLNALCFFASAKNLKLETAGEYGLRLFLQSIGGKTETPDRCEICYRLRLEKTAARAAEQGFDAFSTSLLISPYQRHETIRRLGEEYAAKYGIDFLYRDFRPLFRKGQTQARALGLYMQKYCGCIFSDAEANAQRQAVAFKKTTESPKEKEKANTINSVKLGGTTISFFQRLALITGEDVIKKLEKTTVMIFGLGGVGSWCAEALVRSGVGKICIVDYDTVCESNVNRQVQATSRTLGRVKTEALKERLLEINPRCEVSTREEAFSRETASGFGIAKADYVIDAIDSLPQKLDLIETSCAAGVRFFSSMGMALRLDPTRVTTGSIWETQGCPLAKLVRQGLRQRSFSGDFTVVYSDERLVRDGMQFEPRDENAGTGESYHNSKTVNGSAVTVTATAGMTLASLVLRSSMEKQ